jgi:hypothetical protein
MMGHMNDDGVPPDMDDGLTIDCNTCLATGTTACGDCVVGHVLANEGGPIELVVTPRETETERVIRLFSKAGLLDDPPVFVSGAEFEAASAPLRLIHSS